MTRPQGPRQRAYRPKTSTGCITCKIRRVKCDEAKPHCRKCSSTGRKCDGYTSSSTKTTPSPFVNRLDTIPGLFFRTLSAESQTNIGPNTEKQTSKCVNNDNLHRPSNPTKPVYPTITKGNHILPSLSTGIQLHTSKERELFHFFQTHASLELPGFFKSTFWQREILLATQTFPAIRHAVMAVGALHRRYISGNSTGQEPKGIHGVEDLELRFALLESNRAIQEVVGTGGSKQKQKEHRVTMMTICVLFNCMALIEGRHQEAFQHLRSGLKLLREADEEEERVDNTVTADQVSHPVTLKSLRSIFIGLDAQARVLMKGDVGTEHWEPAPKHSITFPPESGSNNTYDMGDAHVYLESTLNEFLAWANSLGETRPLSDTVDLPSTHEKFLRLKGQAREGGNILEDILSNPSITRDPTQHQALLALRLLRAVVDLALTAFEVRRLGRPEEAEIFESQNHFEEIMIIIEELVAPTSTGPPSSISSHTPSSSLKPSTQRPVFSFTFGVMTTLWWITQATPSQSMRIRAIQIMMQHCRREGFWDGPVAGRLAWEAVLLEQSSTLAELGIGVDTPKYLRIRNIDMDYAGVSGIRVEFKNLRAMERGEKGWVRMIKWHNSMEDKEINGNES
ncbi:hypothetical protein K504DRAFT_530784 [Pleomassaria siparia CBS 279.74]|uniref:Zn(2)-C6 fungal-type domain-containing protein n=1 Tax=Pleomassaria siparia CBS 279.74 TaxID=1314801 RepID=A0A6G1KML4_9PLEO|nr:hypothetical protein K504DRAFT_530784 [Pleomassaria siparia CBS 279.74]